MISNNLAQPIVKTATKAFVKRYPYTIPHYIVYEVTRMIACGTLDMGFEFLKPIDIEDMKRPTQMMSCRIFDWRANKSLLYNSLKKG